MNIINATEQVLIIDGNVTRKLVVTVEGITVDEIMNLGTASIESNGTVYVGFTRVAKYQLDIAENIYTVELIKDPVSPEYQNLQAGVEAIKGDLSFVAAMSGIKTFHVAGEGLEQAKASKLQELAMATTGAIYGGVTVETEEGEEHFSLTLTDQINLKFLSDLANIDMPGSYHADGKKCRMFSPGEILLVAEAAFKHVVFHTTLFNHLKFWVNRCETVDEVNQITYDFHLLPEDLAMDMATLLGLIPSEDHE